jgi:uncharacterized protein with PIN domain
MAKFSERQGITPVRTTLQVDEKSEGLRISLWNVVYELIVQKRGFMEVNWSRPPGSEAEIYAVGRDFWADVIEEPLDTKPDYAGALLKAMRDHYFKAPWYKVYEFVEFLVEEYPRFAKFHDAINAVLESKLSGYRLISGKIVPVTDEQEIQALEEALADEKYPGVRAHLSTALSCLANREKPDYRNSIKESISAVESAARAITGNDKAVLSDALKTLEKQKKLHSALKQGIIKLYGYTSDEDGIRHAMLEEPEITVADAKFFLLSCTSFVNYLKSLA